MTGNFPQDVRLLMQTPTYIDQDPNGRDLIINNFIAENIARNPRDSDYYYQAAQDAQVEFLRSTGQGRHVPTSIDMQAPWQSEEYESLNEDERVEAINQFKATIPKVAEQDKLNQGDTEFFLNQVADAQIRKAKGEDTGWIADKAYRAFDGFAAGLASYAGQQELADNIRRLSSENPQYDDDFLAKLSQGAGDMLASTSIFIGATIAGSAATGNPASGLTIGTGVTLGTNSVSRYQENYRLAIEKGLNEGQAVDAGIASIPGAAVDVLGDRLIAGKFLSSKFTNSFRRADEAGRRALIAGVIKDRSTHGILMNVAGAAFVEGASEAGGDFTAGYGAYLATGEADFIPKNAQLRESFAIGAILGGAISGATDGYRSATTDQELLQKLQGETNRLTIETVSDETAAAEVWALMDAGKYQEAYDLSQKITTTPIQEEQQEEAGITDNSQNPISTFLPKSEAEEALPLPAPAGSVANNAKQTVTAPLTVASSETEASKKLESTPSSVQEDFKREVEKQFGLYTNTPNELNEALGLQPIAESGVVTPSIRFGVSETSNYGNAADNFARFTSARYNNIQLVDPQSVTNNRGVADFSILERSDPQGEFNVQASPELQTKVDEAIAMGKQAEILSLAPVNATDQTRQEAAKVPAIDLNYEGITQYDDANGGTSVYIETEAGLEALIQQLDARFGSNAYVVKDSLGGASEGIYVGEAALRQAYADSKEGFQLNGFYAESYNDNLNTRQPGGDQRVHIIKRGGQLEVVPFATHNRSNSLPYIARTSSVRGIEEAALKYANQAAAAMAEGGMLGVDVVITADGSLLATELNPTQYGTLAEDYGATGSSGFAATPFVQNAIYSHLKGRVPAFVLAGRQILRQQFTEQNLQQGAPKIAAKVKLLWQNSRDQNALRSQLIQNYGEQFADYADQIWTAFTESAGRVTQQIMELIQSIIDTILFRATPSKVSPQNQSVMNSAKTATQLVRNNTNQITANNKRSELPRSIRPVTVDGRVINTAYDIASIFGEDHPLVRLSLLPQIKSYLESIPVFRKRGGSYFNGEIVNIDETADNTTLLHELSHAVLDYAVDNDADFAREVNRISKVFEREILPPTKQGEPPSAINQLMRAAVSEYHKIKRSETFSQFFANNVEVIEAKAKTAASTDPNLNPFNDKNFTDQSLLTAYALTGPHEFLASAMSNREFRKALENTKDKKSLWQRFLDAIKSFFGKNIPDIKNLGQQLDEIINNLGPNYSPQKVLQERQSFALTRKNLRKQRLKQLKELKEAKIDDKVDSNTTSLLRAVKRLKATRIALLNPQEQIRVYELINNIYKARKAKIADPASRINTANLIVELATFQELIDKATIEKRIKDLDGIYKINFDVDNSSLEEFETYINELQKKDEAFQEKKKNRDAKAQATYNKKMDAWRAKFAEIRQQITDNYADAETFLAEYETNEGKKIAGKKLRNFVMAHYDYITSIADVSALSGQSLYRHFFAANNLLDGQFMYAADTTIKHIKNLRDSNVNVEELSRMFRDPVINQGRGILGGLDSAQRATEIAQSQLQRWSAFVDAKDFLQNDLMGPLLETVIVDAKNAESAGLRVYQEAKTKFEKNLKREMNGEDRAAMAIGSRLIQFAVGRDANKEFANNVRNEWKNIYNIVGTPDGKVAGSGTSSQINDYVKVIIPTLERMVQGIMDAPNPMELFMNNINDRFGLGDTEVGAARVELLSQMQEIIGNYTVDNKVISEMFYNKPFTEYANYLPRLVIPINPEQFAARDGTIADEMEKFDDLQYQSASLEAEPGQIKERNGIGNKGHYSHNIEYVFSRGLHVATLSSATTSERFILNARLKGGIIRDMINGSNSTYRVDQLQQWARQVMMRAMHSGQPLGTIGVAMKAVNEAFARVALSGLHQGLTQTISGYSDYYLRTGNIGGAMSAASHYISHKEKMDQFFQDNAAWIGDRSFLGEQELDRRRNIPFDEKSLRNNPWIKQLEKYHDKAGDIITYSLRKGDDFTARSLVLAEYTRLLGQKNLEIKSINQVDFSVVEGQVLTQAILNIEQNINASNKATRGEFFVDRNRGMAFLRNITVAFSSHVMMLAGQFNIAVRDLVDLHNTDGSKADKARAIRTIGAIMTQSLTFSSSKYLINGALALAMIGAMKEMFDDEDGKIASLEEKIRRAKETKNKPAQERAENELKMAISVRKQIDKFSQRQTSFGSYWKNVLKDELGSMHFMFNGPQIPQKFVFQVFDNLGEQLMKEDQAARVDRLKKQIKTLKEQKRYREAARLSENLVLVENQGYLPFNIDQFGQIGLGGITGTSTNAIYASFKEFNDWGIWIDGS